MYLACFIVWCNTFCTLERHLPARSLGGDDVEMEWKCRVYTPAHTLKGGMSRSTCPSESLIFGPRNECLLTTTC